MLVSTAGVQADGHARSRGHSGVEMSALTEQSSTAELYAAAAAQRASNPVNIVAAMDQASAKLNHLQHHIEHVTTPGMENIARELKEQALRIERWEKQCTELNSQLNTLTAAQREQPHATASQFATVSTAVAKLQLQVEQVQQSVRSSVSEKSASPTPEIVMEITELLGVDQLGLRRVLKGTISTDVSNEALRAAATANLRAFITQQQSQGTRDVVRILKDVFSSIPAIVLCNAFAHPDPAANAGWHRLLLSVVEHAVLRDEHGQPTVTPNIMSSSSLVRPGCTPLPCLVLTSRPRTVP